MFRAENKGIIDASFKGSEARYLNHSCDVILLNFSLIVLLNIYKLMENLK